jgi:hypothetical protein
MQVRGAPDLGGEPGGLGRRENPAEGGALDGELAGSEEQAHHRVGPFGGGQQALQVHFLDEARLRHGHGPTLGRAAIRESIALGERFRRLGDRRMPEKHVEHLPERAVEIGDDAGDHVLRLDGHGGPVAEDDQEDEAHDDEANAAHERQLRNEVPRPIAARDHEIEQRMQKGPEEKPDRQLGDPIADKAVQDPRAELAHGHREHEKGDREDQGQDGADGAEQRGEDGPRVVRAADRDPRGQGQRPPGDSPVDLDGRQEEEHDADAQDEGDAPEIDSQLQHFPEALPVRHEERLDLSTSRE